MSDNDEKILPVLRLLLIAFFGLLLVLAFQLFLLVTRAAAATTTIRAGYPQLNGGQTPLWNIPENKIDRQYGIEINPVYIPGGVRLTQSAVSGSVDVALTGGAAVNAMLSGAGSYLRRHAGPHLCILHLRQARDQRGGRPARQSSWRDNQRCLLRSRRHRATGDNTKMTQQDMKVLYFSRQEDALAALKQGIVSAAVHSAPTTLMARRLGFKELVNIGALKLPYPFMGIAIRRSTVPQNLDLIRAFLKAFWSASRLPSSNPMCQSARSQGISLLKIKRLSMKRTAVLPRYFPRFRT